jgi:hypothetical protein
MRFLWVEHSPHIPKIKGLSPAATEYKEKSKPLDRKLQTALSLSDTKAVGLKLWNLGF